MGKKECFGSIQEIPLKNGLTKTSAKPECRTCEEVRDCLRYAKQITEERKEREELRRQDMITQIIDISVVFSNELGSCLLEFLNRIYNSPLGSILPRNLLLFFEIPKDLFSMPLTVPISPATLELIYGEAAKAKGPDSSTGTLPLGTSKEGFFIRIALFQRSFVNNRKANMGLIAHEVARLFSSDQDGVREILTTLDDSEIGPFRRMKEEERIPWLLRKWGFSEELEAMTKEISSLGVKK